MGGVAVGVEEADRDRRDLALLQPTDGAFKLGRVDGRLEVTEGIYALCHLQTKPAWCQRTRFRNVQVIEMRSTLPPELQYIPKAGSRDHPDIIEPVLHDRVRSDRGPVSQGPRHLLNRHRYPPGAPSALK